MGAVFINMMQFLPPLFYSLTCYTSEVALGAYSLGEQITPVFPGVWGGGDGGREEAGNTIFHVEMTMMKVLLTLFDCMSIAVS